MDRLTRKELKSDRFALEVQHSVEYVSDHRRQVIRWGGVAAAVVVIAVGVFVYRSYQHTQRQEALTAALKISNANVGQPNPANPDILTFPTAADRTKAMNKAFGDIIAKYSGSNEAAVAEFTLAVNASDEGNSAEAEKRLKVVIDSGNDQYGSLAKLSLAQLYGSQGKIADGEKLLQSVIDHPTILVSKEQAQISLAELLGPTDPARARKILEPLRSNPRPNISGKAISALSELSTPKK